MNRERALATVKEAIRRIDAHLSGCRDEVLGAEFDDQLSRFRIRLLRFSEAIEDGELPAIDGTMTWAIADSWPYGSSLAEAITSAESDCKRLLSSVGMTA